MTTLEELGGWPAVLGPLLARRDLPAEDVADLFKVGRVTLYRALVS